MQAVVRRDDQSRLVFKQLLGLHRIAVEPAIAPVVPIEAGFGPDPEPVLPVFEQAPDRVVRQRPPIVRPMTKDHEVAAIEAGQPVVGADPKEGLVILDHGKGGVLRQADAAIEAHRIATGGLRLDRDPGHG